MGIFGKYPTAFDCDGTEKLLISQKGRDVTALVSNLLAPVNMQSFVNQVAQQVPTLPFKIPGATNSYTVNQLAENGFLIPDFFKLPQDGTDDAPSINRALQAMAGLTLINLYFLPRTYIIGSAVVQVNQLVNWIGAGWDQNYLGYGTWFHMSSPAFSPFTISGTGCKGSTFQNFAVAQDHPAPVSGWQPAGYPPVFTCIGSRGRLRFSNIFLPGINKGFDFQNCSQEEITNIYGYTFGPMIRIDQSDDPAHIDNIHENPSFFNPAGNQYYLAYTQQSKDCLVLQRADGPHIGNYFVFGARSVIRFNQSAYGLCTHGEFDNIGGDSCKYGIWVDNSVVGTFNPSEPGAYMTVGNLQVGNKMWSGADGNTPSGQTLTDGCAVQVDGVCSLFGNFLSHTYNNGTAVRMTNTTIPSRVEFEKSSCDFSLAMTPANTSFFKMANCSGTWPGDPSNPTLKHIGRIRDTAPGNKNIPLKQGLAGSGSTTNGTVFTVMETAN